MSLLEKRILIYLSIILGVGALAFIIYRQEMIAQKQAAIETEIVAQKQLVDGIVRSQADQVSKADMDKFISDNNINLKAIQDDLNSLHGEVAAVNIAITDSQGQTGGNIPSSNQGPSNPTPPTPVTVPCPNGGNVTCPNTDPFGYQKEQQNLALNEEFSNVKVPIGSVGFSAWQNAPWSVNITPREYKSASVIGTDENQKMYVYNQLSVTVDGKDYQLPIKTATTKQTSPSPSWSWWNPRLLMGLDGGVNISHVQGEFTPSVNVGIMSYGQYKTTPDFSILEVGAGYGTVNKTAQLVVTPVSYNIGKNLFSPLMNNTYVGPSLSINTDGSLGANLGLRVGF